MEIIVGATGVCDALHSYLLLKYQFSLRPNDAESLRQYVRFKVTYLIANQQAYIDQPTNQPTKRMSNGWACADDICNTLTTQAITLLI